MRNMKRSYLRGGSLNCVLYDTVAEQSSKRSVVPMYDVFMGMNTPHAWGGSRFTLIHGRKYSRAIVESNHE